MSRQRTYRIAIRLDDVADADLIAWLESQPRGQRSSVLRQAARLGLNQASQPSNVLDAALIRSVVADELAKALDGRSSLAKPANDPGHESLDLEAMFGTKLDRMMDGLRKTQSHSNTNHENSE
jgi:hypothetical protein